MRNILFILFSLSILTIIRGDGKKTCPSPVVKKRTIIKSEESVANGANYIGKEIVASAHECYNLCCGYENCNVAVMHYKEVPNDLGETEIQKFCYLFDCGTPSKTKCTFKDHHRYAVLELPRAAMAMTTDVPPTTEVPGEKCPPGVPMAMCSDDPCKINSCPADENAACRANYCGGCNAVFYSESGEKVNCTIEDSSPEESVITKDNHNEQSLVVEETDYEETPTESLAPVKTSQKQATKGAQEDPYFNSDRREWLDGEHGTTTEPTKELPKVVKVVHSSLVSIPLLIALIICIILLFGLIYRFKCARKGKPKKFPVDDGDYLINGMYL